MTLKGIERVIDIADYVGFIPGFSKVSIEPIENKEKEKEYFRHANDELFISHYTDGEVRYYYRLNKETGEMTLLAKIDHIDKERKTIKKKLSDMTDEEIWEARTLNCRFRSCNACPLYAGELDTCLINYITWREHYLKYKDREFEVEVDE